jgi:hypothetical protein
MDLNFLVGHFKNSDMNVAMNVIVLTVFIGLILVFLFLFLFVQHFSKPGSFSPDRESLLPLEPDGGFQEVKPTEKS